MIEKLIFDLLFKTTPQGFFIARFPLLDPAVNPEHAKILAEKIVFEMEQAKDR